MMIEMTNGTRIRARFNGRTATLSRAQDRRIGDARPKDYKLERVTWGDGSTGIVRYDA